MSSKTTCPCCLGAKEIMEPKKTRGFKYVKCNLCDGKGKVHPEIADDYIFSLDEENYDDEYE